jgi:hypothetical protein
MVDQVFFDDRSRGMPDNEWMKEKPLDVDLADAHLEFYFLAHFKNPDGR